MQSLIPKLGHRALEQPCATTSRLPGTAQAGQTTKRTSTPASYAASVIAIALLVLWIATLSFGQVATLTAGGAYTCALLQCLENGSTFCWGRNVGGQLGIGSFSSVSSPSELNFPDGSLVSSIAPGDYHSCVVLTSGV